MKSQRVASNSGEDDDDDVYLWRFAYKQKQTAKWSNAKEGSKCWKSYRDATSSRPCLSTKNRSHKNATVGKRKKSQQNFTEDKNSIRKPRSKQGRKEKPRSRISNKFVDLVDGSFSNADADATTSNDHNETSIFPRVEKLGKVTPPSEPTKCDFMQFAFGPESHVQKAPFVANLWNAFNRRCSTISLANAELLIKNARIVCTAEQDGDKEKLSSNSTTSSARHSARKRSVINYSEQEDTFDIWCYGCKDLVYGRCKQHTMLFVFDNPSAVQGTPSYCLQSAPSFVSIGPSKYMGAGEGAWTECALPAGLVFGPYKGQIRHDSVGAKKTGYSWRLPKDNKRNSWIYVDAEPKHMGNWLRFVNCGNSLNECNMYPIVAEQNVWYVISKRVEPGMELLVHYGDEFARKFATNIKKSRVKQSVKENLFACTHCDTAYTDEKRLKRHVEFEHGSKPFKCTYCDFASNKQKTVDNHIERTHLGEQSHICPLCPKTFSSSLGLEHHKTKHSNKRPYDCPNCEKSFKTKAAIINHRRVHTDERPYGCTECGKTFRYGSNLIQHKRVHSGQKPFKCLWCSHRVNQQHVITTHMEKVHRKKRFQCKLCGKKVFTRKHICK